MWPPSEVSTGSRGVGAGDCPGASPLPPSGLPEPGRYMACITEQGSGAGPGGKPEWPLRRCSERADPVLTAQHMTS